MATCWSVQHPTRTGPQDTRQYFKADKKIDMTDFRLLLLLALAAVCHSAPNYQQREPIDASFLGAGSSGSNNFRSYQIGLGGGSAHSLQQTEPPCDDDKTLHTGSQTSRSYTQSQRQVGLGSSLGGAHTRHVGGSYVQHNPTIGQSQSQSYTQSQRKVDVFEGQPSFGASSHAPKNLDLGQARSEDDLLENLNDEQSRLVVSSQVRPGQVSRTQTSSSYSQTQQKVNVFEDEPAFTSGSHTTRNVGASYVRPNPSVGETSSHSSRVSSTQQKVNVFEDEPAFTSGSHTSRNVELSYARPNPSVGETSSHSSRVSSTQQKVNVFEEEPEFLTGLHTSRLPLPSHLEQSPSVGETSHVTRTSSSYTQTQQRVNGFEDQPSFSVGSQPSRIVGTYSRPNPSVDETSSHSSRVSSTQQKVNVFENEPAFGIGSQGSQNLNLGSVHLDTTPQSPRNVGHSHSQSPSIGGSSSQTYRSSRVSSHTQNVGDRPTYGTGVQPNRNYGNAHITLTPTAEETTPRSRTSGYSHTQQKVDVFENQPAFGPGSHTVHVVPSHVRQPSVRDSTLESSRVYDQSQQKEEVFTEQRPVVAVVRVPSSRPASVVFEEQSSYRRTGVRGDQSERPAGSLIKPVHGDVPQQVDLYNGQSGSHSSRTYGQTQVVRTQPVVTSFNEQHSYSQQSGSGTAGHDLPQQLGSSNQQVSSSRTGSQSHRSYGNTQSQPIVYTYTQQSGSPGSRAQGLTQQQEEVFSSQQSVGGSTGSRGYGQNHRLVELSGNDLTTGSGSDGLQVAQTGSHGQGSYHQSYSTSGRSYSQSDIDPRLSGSTADHTQQFQDLFARLGHGSGLDVTGGSNTPGGSSFSTFQSRSWGSSNVNGNCTSHGKTTKVTNNNGVVERVDIEDTPNSNC